MKQLVFAVTMLMFSAVSYADNAALIAKLEGGTAEARDAAKRELLVKAGAADIPALVAMLQKEEAFDAAFFLLESIKTPEADKALWDALEKGEAPHFRKAMPAMVAHGLRTSTDVERLKETALHNNAPEDWRLMAVERLVELKEVKAAISLYAQLVDHAGVNDATRLAALCGLLRTDTGNLDKWLVKGLDNGSAAWRGTTAKLAAAMPEEVLKKPLEMIMDKAPPEIRSVLLSAFADAKNPAGLPLMRKILKNKNASAGLTEYVAAVEALGEFGDADDVDVLIPLLGDECGTIATAAMMSLSKMEDSKTHAKIARAVPKQENPIVTVKLISTLVAQDIASAETQAVLEAALHHTAMEVRRLALLASVDRVTDAKLAGRAANAKQVEMIVDVAAKVVDPKESEAAGRSMLLLVRQYPEVTAKAIVKSFDGANAQMKSAFLKVLGVAGQAEGLAVVRGALKGGDKPVADDAARTLAEWKDIAVIDDLLQIADTHANNSIKVLALRGYIRLIEQDADAASRWAKCLEAAKRVTRPEERMLLIAAYGTVPTQASVEALKPFLEKDGLKADALQALRRIAQTIPVDVPGVKE